MARLAGAVRDLLGEALWIGGLVGGLWFASWLYEVGFMARFHLPATLVDIGLPIGLPVLFVGGVLAAGAVGLLMLGTGAPPGAFTPVAVLTGLVGLLALGAQLPENIGVLLLSPLPPAFDANLGRLALIACLVVYAARFFARCADWGRHAGHPRIAQASALAVALLALPVWLGWYGGERKAASPRSFFYLAEDRAFVLVRIYDEKAVFVRRDPATGTFDREYRILRFGDGADIYITRTARP